MAECLGFFGSKFINEKRKSQSENVLRKFLGKVNRGEYKRTDPETVQVAKYLLQHFYIERKSRDPEDYIKKVLRPIQKPVGRLTNVQHSTGLYAGEQALLCREKGEIFHREDPGIVL